MTQLFINLRQKLTIEHNQHNLLWVKPVALTPQYQLSTISFQTGIQNYGVNFQLTKRQQHNNFQIMRLPEAARGLKIKIKSQDTSYLKYKFEYFFDANLG